MKVKAWFALGIIGFFLNGCIFTGQAFRIDGFDTNYKSSIQKIAIFPFDNRTQEPNVEFTVYRAVYKRLMKISSVRGSPIILHRDKVERTLYRMGISTYRDAMEHLPQEFENILGADGVLVGIVRIYSQVQRRPCIVDGRFTFEDIPISTVETQFQLYSCKDGELLWEKVALGVYLHPVLHGVGQPSVEIATRLMCDDLIASWPFSKAKWR